MKLFYSIVIVCYVKPWQFFFLTEKDAFSDFFSKKQFEALTRMSFKLLAFVNLIIKNKP